MKFEQGMIILKKENPQHIIITKCGIFYYAIGNDALILEKVLKLKKICFKKYICKVGIIEKNLSKSLQILKNEGFKYIVYQYNKDNYLGFEEQFVKIYQNDEGIKELQKIQIDCKKCLNWKNQKNNEYINNKSEQLQINNYNNFQQIKNNNLSKEYLIDIKQVINKILDNYINSF